MLNNSLAPIKRAGIFFGFMGAAVFALTLGSEFQETNPDSSSAVAQAKIERQLPTDTQFAAVDPAERSENVAKRAIGGSQQAMVSGTQRAVLR
jgi:hypothetical protein